MNPEQINPASEPGAPQAPETQPQGTNAAVSGEQASDLAALQRMAAEGEQAQAQGQGEQVTQSAPLHEEVGGLLKMMAAMVKPALPSVSAIYTDEVCGAVGNAVAPVCQKYGWLQGGIGGQYSAEILCLAVVGPLAWATVQAAKSDLAAGRAKQIESKPTNEIAAPKTDDGKPVEPGAATVQIGAAVTP